MCLELPRYRLGEISSWLFSLLCQKGQRQAAGLVDGPPPPPVGKCAVNEVQFLCGTCQQTALGTPTGAAACMPWLPPRHPTPQFGYCSRYQNTSLVNPKSSGIARLPSPHLTFHFNGKRFHPFRFIYCTFTPLGLPKAVHNNTIQVFLSPQGSQSKITLEN